MLLTQASVAVAQVYLRRRRAVASSIGNSRHDGWFGSSTLAPSEPMNAAAKLTTTKPRSTLSSRAGTAPMLRRLSASTSAARPEVNVPSSRNHNARPERRRRLPGARDIA